MRKTFQCIVRFALVLELLCFAFISMASAARLDQLTSTFNNQTTGIQFPVCQEISSPALTRVNTVLYLQSYSPIDAKALDTSMFTDVSGVISRNRIAYLEQQRKAKIRSEVASRGSMGRLYAPSIGIDVALFKSMSQAVCDAPDSACYFYLGGAPVIGDHQNQGFSRIRSAVPGSTLMYISDGTNITTYRCVASYNGYNTGYDLTDEAGVSAAGKYPGSTILYTCRQDWQHITIVHISPVS